MKKFIFRLEKLLEIRAFRENEAKLALGRAVSECEKIKTKIAQIDMDKSTARSQMSLENGFSLNSFVANENYIKLLDLAKEKQLAMLDEAEQKLEAVRSEYNERLKEFRVLERLKEKDFARWKKDYLTEQDNVIDDIKR